MKIRNFLFLILFVFITPELFADTAKDTTKTSGFLRNFNISGYVQAQFQYGEKDADLKVGGDNENAEKPFNRFGVRRGRVKLVYEQGIASGTFQIDLTEKGIKFKDVYLNIKDPWMKTNALRAGIFDRPFGYEISYSSSRRESPERSTVFQTLFPDERDLGAMLILQPFKQSFLSFFKLQAGMFAGNGINLDTDNRKDFIGRLNWESYIGMNFNLGVGFSYYNGGVYQGTDSVYKMRDGHFELNSTPANKGKYAKREYFGFDVELGLATILGKVKIHTEYLFGQQPGSATSTKSPNRGLPDFNTYIRSFRGGYVMFVQDISTSPFSVVFKYDWYNPNIDVKGNDVGLNIGTSIADIRKETFGFGALYNINKNIRLQAYYEIDNYEKSENLPLLAEFKSNAFTVRLQYKF